MIVYSKEARLFKGFRRVDHKVRLVMGTAPSRWSLQLCYSNTLVVTLCAPLTPALFRRTGQTILTVVAPFTTIRFISLFYAQVAKV